MVANMEIGNMERFCVVANRGTKQLVHQNIGYTALTTGELWANHPEKALGMRAAWVDKYPAAAKALLMAVMEAQMWCDKMENKPSSPRLWRGVNGSTFPPPTSSTGSKAISITAMAASPRARSST